MGTPPNAQDPTDWHHFLCEGEPSALPEQALLFVGFGERPSLELAPVAPATLLSLSEYKAQPMAGALVLWHPDFDADPALREKVAVAPTTPTLPALPQRGRGMGVHRSEVWLTERGFDAARVGVVEVYDAQDYLRAREQTPSTLAQLLTLSIAVRAPQACAELALRLGTRCP